MGRLQTKTAEYKYREYGRLLTEQFIGGFNNKGMTDELLRVVTMLEDIEKATSEQVLTWAHRVKVQRAQRIALSSIKEAIKFDAIWQSTRNK